MSLWINKYLWKSFLGIYQVCDRDMCDAGFVIRTS